MADAISRSKETYDERFGRFVLHKTDYVQQFCHMYQRRVNQMRAPLSKAAEEKWSLSANNVRILDKIIDSESMEDSECVLIGTIYKEMQLKPSVLDEYKEKNGIMGAGVQERENFASDSDVLILEDESGRANLAGMECMAGKLVTGVTMAIKGSVKAGGSFHATGWLNAGDYLAPAITPSSTQTSPSGARYVLLVSGLEIGADDASLPAAQLLVDFVCGKLGGYEQRDMAKNIVRVICCGNNMGQSPVRLEGMERFTNPQKTKQNKLDIEDFQSSSSRHLDGLLSQIAVSCPVDLMPGATDPSNYTMPQQPIHPCMLSTCSRLSTLTLATNPYEAQVGHRVLMGHSGQPLKDLMLNIPLKEKDYVKEEDASSNGNKENANAMDVEAESKGKKSVSSLELLEQCIRWGHIAPTAPDSLACYPFIMEDPFIMDSLPDVFFAGNMDEYATGVVENFAGAKGRNHKTRLVCVPSFKITGQVVLLDIMSLDTQLVTFQA